MAILSIVEYIFNKSSESRLIEFEEISISSHVNSDFVELFLMRALSVGLIKGRIDQTKNNILITWVQPRILSIDQISNLKERLVQWEEKVSNVLHLVQDQISPELIS